MFGLTNIEVMFGVAVVGLFALGFIGGRLR